MGEAVNPELFKIEFKRGIDALLPYSRAHKRTKIRVEAPAPGHNYEFPPYFMIFTIDSFPGADCPMVSVSAPMRPVKTLSASEKDMVQEAFADVFPDHNMVAFPKALLPGNSAFKIVAIPPGAPSELADAYKSMSLMK